VKFTKIILAGLTAIMLAAGIGAAQAAPITFRFGGQVTISPVSGINIGDSISGLYTFDSDATAQFPSSPNVAIYDTGLSSYSVQVGIFSGAASSGRIIVADNFGGSIDVYNAGTSVLTGTSMSGLTAFQSFIELSTVSGTALSSFALPLSPPDLSDFSARTIVLRFLDASTMTNYTVRGSLTLLEAVPAPGALAVLGLGLLGIGGLRRKKLSGA
jgi:hypothetical protein